MEESIFKKLRQPEGRRLEFKETLPKAEELAKTVVALSNDAGGEIFVGIRDNPREIVNITSPGTLPPSIDIGDLSGGQSEIRNRVLAPIFKKLGLIEQWGTGFRKIQQALKEYPNIELRINEPGMAFQIQFVKKDYQSEEVGSKLGLSREQVPSKYRASKKNIEFLYGSKKWQRNIVLS